MHLHRQSADICCPLPIQDPVMLIVIPSCRRWEVFAMGLLAKIVDDKHAVYCGTAAAVLTGSYVLYKMVGGDTGFRTNFFKVGNTGALSREDMKDMIDGYEEFFTQV